MKRLISIIAATLLLATSLAGCGAPKAFVPNSHVTIAQVGKLSTLNPDVYQANAQKIPSDLAILTSQNFYEINESGELVANPSFGTAKVVKRSPFTVTYTFGKTAVWSDGSKLDSTDLALAVAAAKNSQFNSIHFGSSLATAKIVGSPKAGEATLTLQFEQPTENWKTVLDPAVPAHVVGKVAGIGGNVAAVRAGVLAAILEQKVDILNALATAYASAFTPEAALENFVTSGAYGFSSVNGNKIVLKVQKDFEGLHGGIAETVNFLIFDENASAFKSVDSGESDIFSPPYAANQQQSDLVSQAKSLNSKSVTLAAQGSFLTKQFVLNLGSGNLADSSYPEIKTALALRKAFLNIVPKARAIDFSSISQVVSKSDSFVYSQSNKNYSAVTGSNGSSDYLIQDAEKASEILGTLGLTKKPTIRVLFDSDNPTSVAEWTLLSDHSSTSGFRLANVSSSDPSATLASGLYEVYIGDLPLLGSGFGSLAILSDGPAKLPAETFVEISKDVLAADEKTLNVALQALDKTLFEIGYGLPLYQLPTLLVFNKRIQGLKVDPYGTNSTWGYWSWHVSADK